MINTIEIDGFKAVVNYDPEIDMFRGEFINTNGGADFYASSVEDLKKEAALSLKVFLELCKEEGLSPQKSYSGKWNLRTTPEIHEKVTHASSAEGVSINAWVQDAILEKLNSDKASADQSRK